MTKIEWTHLPGYKGETWNPTLGCRRASPGCTNCYAARVAHRGMQDAHKGLTELDANGVPRFNGVAREMPERLATPLGWKKPRAIFVNSMSDLFLPGFSNEYIAAVFGVMAACPQHIFLVLTKHPDRAREWFAWMRMQWCAGELAEVVPGMVWDYSAPPPAPSPTDPLPNVWLGTSCEDQERADERIPLLLQCPAAVRFVSAEPLLGRIDLTRLEPSDEVHLDALRGTTGSFAQHVAVRPTKGPALDWVIVGSESGPRARPMDIAWARSIVDQCRGTDVACFLKQISNEHDRKGGNPEHWPAGDWPREWPR